jgi:hypothetical protein
MYLNLIDNFGYNIHYFFYQPLNVNTYFCKVLLMNKRVLSLCLSIYFIDLSTRRNIEQIPSLHARTSIYMYVQYVPYYCTLRRENSWIFHYAIADGIFQ